MARAFRPRGRGPHLRYAAKLDEVERAVVIGLMEQVIELLDPPEPPGVSTDGRLDDFEAIVAGMGGLGQGISVRAEDQADWPARPPVPPEARSFGDRDPALQRLLPQAHRDDEEAAAEFRRLTEDGLRRRKAENLTRSIAAMRGRGTVELDAGGALAFLVALTDVRLVLGERLGLREDADVERLDVALASLADDDPTIYAAAVYDFLTWLQESLATAMLGVTGA